MVKTKKHEHLANSGFSASEAAEASFKGIQGHVDYIGNMLYGLGISAE